MGRFLKLFLGLLLLLFSAKQVFADGYKVLVLPDNIQFDSTNYYIFPDSSVMFATDTINEIRKDGKIQTVSMTEVRDSLRKDTALYVKTKNALKEFKYNYNIPFVDFKSIAHTFSTDKILVITSQTDAQNYVLRRTVWDVLNIPGMTTFTPEYKMSTYVALIDVDKEQIIWQNTYYKKIGAFEKRIMAQNFAPATEQLEKIKFYSSTLLSPHIARTVETKILPPLLPTPNDKGIVNISNIKVPPMPSEELETNVKRPIPSRTKNKTYGEMINDL